jgi:preprotein translocase subunit YajC
MQKRPRSLKRFVKTGGLVFLFLLITYVSVRADEATTAPAVPADSASVQGATSSAAGAATAPAQPGLMSMAFPFLAMFAVFYFLMGRPQQKKMKDHQKLLSELKKGDEVVTTSGFIGTIAGIADKVVTLDLGGNCKVKVLKSQISQLQSAGTLKELT